MFRLPTEHRLDAVRTQLDSVNADADRFRVAATAARNGDRPAKALVDAAEDAHDGLMMLLEDLDAAIDSLPAGDTEFPPLLRAQVATMALLESVGNSLFLLESSKSVAVREPTHIAHQVELVAAE